MTSRRRRSRCRDQKYDPIAFTIIGRVTKSHEVDGITVIDDIEVESVGGVPLDLFKNRYAVGVDLAHGEDTTVVVRHNRDGTMEIVDVKRRRNQTEDTK
jgi:hypothetical protein